MKELVSVKSTAIIRNMDDVVSLIDLGLLPLDNKDYKPTYVSEIHNDEADSLFDDSEYIKHELCKISQRICRKRNIHNKKRDRYHGKDKYRHDDKMYLHGDKSDIISKINLNEISASDKSLSAVVVKSRKMELEEKIDDCLFDLKKASWTLNQMEKVKADYLYNKDLLMSMLEELEVLY